MKKSVFLWVVLLCFLLSGCTKKVDLGPGYTVMSRNFLQAMRWQDFRGAAAYLQEGSRPEFLASFNGSQDLHIVDAEYQYSRLHKGLGTAESALLLKYYLLPSTRVRDWVWEIDWSLIPVDSQQRGTWQVQGAPPTFP